MTVKNLKRIALILILFFVITICVYAFRSRNNANGNTNTDEISTDISIDIDSLDTENERNYTNLTEYEQSVFVREYGAEYVKITEQGVVILANDYDENEERLLTNIWPDTVFTNAVIKPEFGKINLIEVGETYLTITIKDIDKKDVDKYIKETQETFKTKSDLDGTSLYYRAYDEDRNRIEVYYPDDSRVIITYQFSYRR